MTTETVKAWEPIFEDDSGHRGHGCDRDPEKPGYEPLALRPLAEEAALEAEERAYSFRQADPAQGEWVANRLEAFATYLRASWARDSGDLAHRNELDAENPVFLG